MEGRRLTKGNVIQDNTHQTQGWNDAVSTGLDRIRLTAKKDKDVKFTALMHHVTIDRLRGALKLQRKMQHLVSTGKRGQHMRKT